MLELLRDPAWQFVGVVLALLAVAVPLVVYQHQRDRRELAFGVFYETPLLGVSRELAGRVQISLDGQAVPNLRLVVLAVKNSGNRPILAVDFHTPLVIRFGSGATALSAQVARRVPENLPISASLSNNEVHIPPLLLNPGDFAIVKVLTTGVAACPTADVRLAGVPRIAPINHINELPGRTKVRRNLVLMPVVALVAVAFFVTTDELPRPVLLVVLPVMVVIPILQWLVDYLRNKTNRYADDA